MSTNRQIDKEIYRPENYLKESWELTEYSLRFLALIIAESSLRINWEYTERLLRVGLSTRPCPNCTIRPNSSICTNSSLCPLCPNSRMNPESVTGITPRNPWLSAHVLIAPYVRIVPNPAKVWPESHPETLDFSRMSWLSELPEMSEAERTHESVTNDTLNERGFKLTCETRSIKVRLSGWKNPAFGWFEVRYRTFDLLSQIRQIVTLEK
jgi:hypothetical protein